MAIKSLEKRFLIFSAVSFLAFAVAVTNVGFSLENGLILFHNE